MEASYLVSQSHVSGIALAVSDIDFVYVAERLRALGHHTLAVVPSGCFNRLVSAFENVGAEVLRFMQHKGDVHMPQKKLVLHLDGEGSVEDTRDEDNEDSSVDEEYLAETLMKHDYIFNMDDSLVPGLAKFYRENLLGSLTVWPTSLALREAMLALSKGQDSPWNKNSGDMIFALPMASGKTDARSLAKYGSINCARFASAGGPFMITDSRESVLTFLRRLGYLDDFMNSNVGEAIDVFCQASVNKRALSKIGLQVSPVLREQSKLSVLHGAIVSSKLHGTWQIAPSDFPIRKTFARSGLISSQRATPEEIFEAMRQVVEKRGLRRRDTYNGLVVEVLRDLQASRASGA
eukprot:TRINITY_DN67720_c0_g1_i2.p1 TRINITY_DN67720_c0_g1~~TRINITY_DN67720_c0_g1_i2.p1  ORF type:complete len:395 (+),score=57.20 TRINITY_DN67720_c0_g1_i2:141-1187(+)